MADDDGSADEDESGGEDEPAGDPVPNSGQRAAGYVSVGVVLVVGLAVSTILVGLPPKWPQDLQGWSFLLLGSAVTLLCGLATSQFGALSRSVSRGLTHPWSELLGRAFGNGWKAMAGLAAVVLVLLASTLVRPPADEDLEPGTITILSAFSQSPNDPRRILIDQWNQTHPNNQVVTVDAPGGTDQQHERYANDARPDGSHDADVYVLDNVWMQEFIEGGWIRPLDASRPSTTDEEFLPNVFATCKDLTGKRPGTWALPFNADAGVLFSRSDLLGGRTFGTWDDYLGAPASALATGAKAQPTGATIAAADAAAWAENDEILTVAAFEGIWAAGGQVANRDGQPVLSPDRSEVVFDDQARRGVQKLAAAYRDRTITLPDADRTDADGAITKFRNGSTLFMRNWPVASDKLRDPAQGPSVPFGISALPGPSVLGGQNLAISSHTDTPRAAQALIRFLTSPASELTLFEIGGVPPTRDQAYDQVSPLTRPDADAVRQSVRTARPRVITPYYTKFSAEFRRGMITAMRNNGQIEPELPRRLGDILNGK